MDNSSQTRKRVRGAIGRDLVIILAGGLIVYGLSARYDLLERFYEFSRAHDSWELDELVTVAVYLMVALGFFALRRLREIAVSRKELKRRNRELQEALGEVKELRGLLPICANCKSIRDDEGFWHQVEAYILQHSDVTLTHGLCPDCLRKLYPEYCSEDEPRLSPEYLHPGAPDNGTPPGSAKD